MAKACGSSNGRCRCPCALTFADVLPVHIAQRTRSLAVDSFAIVWSQDDVGERAAVVDQEEGLLVAAFLLAVTRIRWRI